jgi:hypothetical protein
MNGTVERNQYPGAVTQGRERENFDPQQFEQARNDVLIAQATPPRQPNPGNQPPAVVPTDTGDTGGELAPTNSAPPQQPSGTPTTPASDAAPTPETGGTATPPAKPTPPQTTAKSAFSSVDDVIAQKQMYFPEGSSVRKTLWNEVLGKFPPEVRELVIRELIVDLRERSPNKPLSGLSANNKKQIADRATLLNGNPDTLQTAWLTGSAASKGLVPDRLQASSSGSQGNTALNAKNSTQTGGNTSAAIKNPSTDLGEQQSKIDSDIAKFIAANPRKTEFSLGELRAYIQENVPLEAQGQIDARIALTAIGKFDFKELPQKFNLLQASTIAGNVVSQLQNLAQTPPPTTAPAPTPEQQAAYKSMGEAFLKANGEKLVTADVLKAYFSTTFPNVAAAELEAVIKDLFEDGKKTNIPALQAADIVGKIAASFVQQPTIPPKQQPSSGVPTAPAAGSQTPPSSGGNIPVPTDINNGEA